MYWYRFNMGDYARATSHLTPTEHGVYLLLTNHYLATEGPLRDDFDFLARIAKCRTRHEKDALRSIRDQFYERIDGKLMHRSLDEIIQKYQQTSSTNRSNVVYGRYTKRLPNSETQDLSNQEPISTSPNGDVSGAAAPRRANGRGNRLPAGWAPSAAGMQFAADAIGPERARSELDAFADYWTAAAGSRGVKADWEATWRNWIRRSGNGAGKQAGRQSSYEVARRFAERDG